MNKNHTNRVPFRTTRNEDWRDSLSQSIQQSINFFSDPSNLSKQESESITRWVVAGVSEKIFNNFKKLQTVLVLKMTALN